MKFSHGSLSDSGTKRPFNRLSYDRRSLHESLLPMIAERSKLLQRTRASITRPEEPRSD